MSHFHATVSPHPPHSVHEPEVQPLHALILRAYNVVILFFLGHCIPLPVSDLVAPDVESFDEEKQKNVGTADSKQDLVAASIQRLVIVSVDV